MADQFERSLVQKAEESERLTDEKGVSTANRTDHHKSPTRSGALHDRDFTGSSHPLTTQNTTAVEAPVDPAQTLGRALSEPDNIGENSSGFQAKLDDSARQGKSSQLRGRGPGLNEANPQDTKAAENSTGIPASAEQ